MAAQSTKLTYRRIVSAHLRCKQTVPCYAKRKCLNANTIVSAENNTVSVFNASNIPISLPFLDIQSEPLKNCHVFKINSQEKFINALNYTDGHANGSSERISRIYNSLETYHCSQHEKMVLKNLINKYNDVFHIEGDGLTFAKSGEHHIFTKPGTNPVNTKQYRLPHGQKPLVREKIAEMLKNGIIEPSTSLWNSPILLVPKKSCNDKKEYRFCVDHKNENKTAELRTFPMPNLDEELSKMNGAKYFSALDIASAFHQIKMHESDKEKTAFTAENKKFQFTRMPFGLSGSPITWQCYITTLLGDLLNTHTMAYADDIMIHTPTINEHIETLTKVLDRLKQSGLKLNLAKTKLFCKRIEYLGHVIDENGVKPNGKNTEAIKNVPVPKNVKEVHN